MNSILENVTQKYKQNFEKIELNYYGSDKKYQSENYILHIFSDIGKMKKYQNNFYEFQKSGNNIAEIIEWNNQEKYFIQERIDCIPDWLTSTRIKEFFLEYTGKQIYNQIDHSIGEFIIYKLYLILKNIDDNSLKNDFKVLIKEIQKHIELFSEKRVYLIHGDLSDTNILFTGKKYYIIDYENISYFDYYYDLVSFDLIKGENNSEIYKIVFEKSNKTFSQKRYDIMKKIFILLQKNNLGNLI